MMFDEYLSLLNKKLDTLKKIKFLAAVQHDLLEKEKFDVLSQNIDNMKKLADDVSVIDKSIGKFREDALTGGERVKASDIEDSIRKIMDEIRIKNTELKEKIKIEMAECKKEIRDISAYRKSLRGYGNINGYRESAYFDKKS
ncbi:MAG: hypothetical protein N2171_02890 [Clostridia bacterium]|nr:hypothetical protein [Clostridia bacterium]